MAELAGLLLRQQGFVPLAYKMQKQICKKHASLKSKLFQVWVFQTSPVESRHYSFTTEGPILFSSTMAHIAVPVQVKPIEESLPLVFRLVSHVNKMAKAHPRVHQLEALSHVVTKEYKEMSGKLNDVFLSMVGRKI